MVETLNSAAYYPVFLKVKGKRCVVVGGGEVALRKVQTLLEQGAAVEVVSPALCPELEELAQTGKIQVKNRQFEPADLSGALLAIAATDEPDINKKVAAEARRQNTLLNVVDNPEFCDFIVPSSIHRGDLTIAISTGGVSPALSRKIRMRLEELLGEEYAALTDLIGGVRAELKAKGVSVSGDKWQKALDLDSLAMLLKEGKKEEAKALLIKRLTNG